MVQYALSLSITVQLDAIGICIEERVPNLGTDTVSYIPTFCMQGKKLILSY